MRLYSLLDTAAREYGPVMLFQNDAVARRWLQDQLPAQSLERRRSYDFQVFCLGVMDVHTGVIVATVPELVQSLVDALNSPSPSAEEMADGSR